MRHAYLIIAHSNWEQLKILLNRLDAPNNDIYVHIDKKAKNVPRADLAASVHDSAVSIYQEYKVYWGSYELVQTELFLFEKAHQNRYDYYHLLSGADLPIKSLDYINDFFEKNRGCEFVQYDTEERLQNDREIKRRTKVYHFLQNYRRRYKSVFLNAFFTFLERVSIVIQLAFHVNRMKKHPDFTVKYGSQWVSITDALVTYILGHQELIESVFRYTNCADELFIQSLVYNSDFKERLYDKDYDDDVRGNMRLIDMKQRGRNGNPYTWRMADWQEIEKSPCLFARKFNLEEDADIVRKLQEYTTK